MSQGDCILAFSWGRKKDAERLLPQIEQPADIRKTEMSKPYSGVWPFPDLVSLLHLAAYHGWVDVAIDLITKYKCETNCKDSYGHTPLHYAAYNNCLEVVRYFINEQHCDPMTKEGGVIHHFTMLVAMAISILPCTSSVRHTVTHYVGTMMVIHHFTVLVAMVISILPCTSSVRHTVTHYVRTTMVKHHFTLLVRIIAVLTLCNTYYLQVWTHWLKTRMARLQ